MKLHVHWLWRDCNGNYHYVSKREITFKNLPQKMSTYNMFNSVTVVKTWRHKKFKRTCQVFSTIIEMQSHREHKIHTNKYVNDNTIKTRDIERENVSVR